MAANSVKIQVTTDAIEGSQSRRLQSPAIIEIAGIVADRRISREIAAGGTITIYDPLAAGSTDAVAAFTVLIAESLKNFKDAADATIAGEALDLILMADPYGPKKRSLVLPLFPGLPLIIGSDRAYGSDMFSSEEAVVGVANSTIRKIRVHNPAASKAKLVLILGGEPPE